MIICNCDAIWRPQSLNDLTAYIMSQLSRLLRNLPEKLIIINSLLTPVGVQHLIALLTIQCFQIPLTTRMFSVWDFVVGMFVRKTNY